MASVLGTTYRVHKTQGNLNNHIGLPLTLLQIGEDTEVAVIEMGMSGRGEIELLSELAQPDMAIITMIGDAHLLQLGSREEIARAKTEILGGLQDGGLFISNGDEPLIDFVLPEIKSLKKCAGSHLDKSLRTIYIRWTFRLGMTDLLLDYRTLIPSFISPARSA
nr:Mur ligase family protein [Paenibacillus larvae]